MSERVNPFANLADTPVFTVKPKPEKPVEKETIEKLAEQNNFPSRQASKPAKVERRKMRVYRTGRNQQFNAKLTAETVERIYKLADEKKSSTRRTGQTCNRCLGEGRGLAPILDFR